MWCLDELMRRIVSCGFDSKMISGDAAGERGLNILALHIKPVSFVCEIHTVIEHGRRAGGGATGGGGGGAGGAMPLGTRLAIAHFRQDHGAASSFQRVVQTLEKMLKKRDLLVMDRKKRRAMQKILIG